MTPLVNRKKKRGPKRRAGKGDDKSVHDRNPRRPFNEEWESGKRSGGGNPMRPPEKMGKKAHEGHQRKKRHEKQREWGGMQTERGRRAAYGTGLKGEQNGKKT